MVVVDRMLGDVFDKIGEHVSGGSTARDNYICDKTKASIIILGASRAVNHYNPVMMGKMMNSTCYDCGQNGNGILLMYGRYKMLSERYTPRLIIYDVCSEFDILSADDNHRYLGWLRPHFYRKGIDSIIGSVDEIERLKMVSRLYSYNSRALRVLGDYVHPLSQDVMGSTPLYGCLDYEPSKDTTRVFSYDSLKLFYLEKLMKETKRHGTKLIFVISPYYHKPNMQVYAPLFRLSRMYHIPIADFTDDSLLVHKKNFFYDSHHLNKQGCDIFTRQMIDYLKHSAAR